jgi:hypothetical protein
MPIPRDEAERLTNQAVRGNKLRRGSRIFLTVALVAIAYLIASALGFLPYRSSRFSRARNPSPAWPGVKLKAKGKRK